VAKADEPTSRQGQQSDDAIESNAANNADLVNKAAGAAEADEANEAD
jgi:hypothetical protein